ncbi:phosphatidylinositol 4-phosphate 5-kinase-like protein 1 isoform X2 [Synchiropus splendidus]|uniref:phosphatidylinositol 4-phosphate 5-kinase-like protein 1 isoform X2 n=1 Tax=Synchiropus splendidus TaxID=270530 RepID=UPI00237D4B4E|nr:phosphatidylinositol 4-phosphate 5-kinase-like protein 1 isoform X2 [Synchiropus splendidus]
MSEARPMNCLFVLVAIVTYILLCQSLASHSPFHWALATFPANTVAFFPPDLCVSMAQVEMSVTATGVGVSTDHQGSGKTKRRRWGGLRQRWKLLGLFEIDQHHEFYGLTCMMKEGLAAAIQTTIDNEPSVQMSDGDFKSEVTRNHENFTMDTFAGPVFASLRGTLGISEQEYQQSLCSENCYLQFISNSKSKADFFLTNDKRFFLKTQNQREVNFLLGNLKLYMEHLKTYPHSLLVKFLGVHRIKKYFIVMQSVFYPDDRINERYDIKGCEVSRWTAPAPEGSPIIVVLKDLNFEGQYIKLDRQRSWLLQQVEIDTNLLKRLNVLDYSLLLAHQPLHSDERNSSLSFANVIMRAKRSVNPACGPSKDVVTSVPGAVQEENAASSCADVDCSQKSQILSPEKAKLGGGRGESSCFKAQNLRLLPDLKNPLHVIDGPEQRYFIGIIDIFTVYSFKKRLEHWWKTLRHLGRTFSTVSPPAYRLRLCRWVQDHTL